MNVPYKIHIKTKCSLLLKSISDVNVPYKIHIKTECSLLLKSISNINVPYKICIKTSVPCFENPHQTLMFPSSSASEWVLLTSSTSKLNVPCKFHTKIERPLEVPFRVWVFPTGSTSKLSVPCKQALLKNLEFPAGSLSVLRVVFFLLFCKLHVKKSRGRFQGVFRPLEVTGSF